MKNLLSSRLLWGVVLVVGGVLLLLDTFGIFKGGDLFWTLVTVFVGILFLCVYFLNHDHWWALIPGVIFIAVAVLIGLNAFLPEFTAANLGGAIMLGGIALAFLLVYLVQRANWWAIIPAGVMATLAVVSVIDASGAGNLASGGVFFLGLGITFLLVAVLPSSTGQMRWAWIPAGILGVIGVLVLLAQENLINYLWPIAIIVVGGLLIIRSLWRRKI